MTLEELSEVTKIPRASLEAIEEERFEALPGPVFVKGFLRCCARALDVDGDAVIDLLYEQERARARVGQEGAQAEGAVAEVGAVAPVPPVTPAPASRAEHLRDRLTGALSGVSAGLGEIAARLPRSHVLMWIVVGLLVLGLVLAVYVAAGAQRAALPHS